MVVRRSSATSRICLTSACWDLLAAKLDAIFQHRIQRLVRKDGTVSYEGRFFEVPYELTGKTVWLVVDPHTHTAVGVEDEAGACLGAVTPLGCAGQPPSRAT